MSAARVTKLLWGKIPVFHGFRLGNLQAIVIDTVVHRLYETQLLSEKRNAVHEFGYSRKPTNEARAESNLFELALQGGGKRSQLPCPKLFWAWLSVVKGINDGFVKGVPSSPFTFQKNENYI